MTNKNIESANKNNITKNQIITLAISIASVTIMSSLVILTYNSPSMWNDVLNIDVPKGMNFDEAIAYKKEMDECLKWGSWGGETGNLKSWKCTLNENIVKPFGFEEKCGDLYQKYVYTCESKASGCPDNYVLTLDHWNSYICVKQDYYDHPCQDPDYPIVDGWTKSGVQCRGLSDSEKLDLLLERNE